MPTRRFAMLASSIGAIVGIALTYPLVLHPASTVLDDGTHDAFQFIWNVWWVREALVTLHTNPFYTKYLFYPDGASLLFHTFSAPLGLLSIPFQLVLPGGAITAHNLLVMAAPALGVCMTALLAREVTGDPWAGIAAGLVAVLNVALTWFLPVIYLTSTWLVAAVLWAWWRLHRRRRARDVGLVVLLLVALLFTSQEYAMMALALLALDGAARVIAPRPLGLPPGWLPGALAAGTLAGVVFAGVAVVASHNPAQGLREGAVMSGSGFLMGFLRPPWLSREEMFPFWFILYLGTAPLLLLTTAPLFGRAQLGYWALALAFVLLMACGPEVGLYHPVLGGPPGAERLARLRVPGPYAGLLKIFPLMGFLRAAYRWVAVAQVILGVVVAIGVAGLRRRLVDDRVRHAVSVAILLAIVALGAVDARAFRKPVVPAEVPSALEVVRDDPEACAVLELPSGVSATRYTNMASQYMFYQTAHRKYLLDGTVARIPLGATRLVGRKFSSLADVPWVKYVVIHRDRLASALPPGLEQVAQVDALLPTEATLVRQDGPLEIYHAKTFRPETVR